MFMIGSFLVAVCSVLLLIALLATVFIQREFTDIEKFGAYLVAALVGFWWWRRTMRRLGVHLD